MPFINGAPNLTVDIPVLERYATEHKLPICGKDFKTGQTLIKTRARADVQGPHARCRRVVLHEHPRQPRRRGARRPRQLQDEGRVEARRARAHPRARALPAALRRRVPQGAHQLLPAARRQQGGLGQHRHLRLARLPDAAEGRLPVPRLDPRRAARTRPGAVHRPRAARRARRHPGVAELLLQGAAGARRACIPSTTCSSSRRS